MPFSYFEKDSLQEPFISRLDDDDSSINSTSSRSPTGRRFTWVVVHTLVIAVYTLAIAGLGILIFQSRSSSLSSGPNDATYSHFSEAIAYTDPVIFDATPFSNEFTGPPRPEQDAAWRRLLSNIHIRVPGKTVEQLNRTSLELRDGSGYVGMLGVFHELHCLKIIRHLIHQDYYPEEYTPEKLPEALAHVDHCLEFLRRNAMCNVDLDLVTFEWKNDHGPLPVFEAPRVCIDWDRFNDWAGERQFNLWETEKLKGGVRRPSSVH